MNYTVAESIGMSLAHIMYGQSLRMLIDHLDGMHLVQVAQDQVLRYRSGKRLRMQYRGSYSKHRHTRRSMLTCVGIMWNMQWVTGYFRQFATLRMHRPRKFRDRYVGEFRVIVRTSNNAYHLDLSGHKALHGVHNLFHILLLCDS